MTNSFTKKLITVKLTLAKGALGEELGNTVTLEGHRVVCAISKGGHPSKNEAKIQIYGMKMDLVNQFVRNPFAPLAARKNLVQVLAGDVESGMHLVFQGEITEASASFKAPPSQYLAISVIEGYYPSLKSAAPKSFSGSVAAETIFKQLAIAMGYTFENNGVSAQIANPYLSGSEMQQASDLAQALNLEFGVDDGVLFIAPRNAARMSVGTTPLITPKTGMKEYPVFDKAGLQVDSMFLPSVKLGGVFEVRESVVENANGVWRITGLQHQIESENPSGRWETKLKSAPKTNPKGQPVDSGGEE